MAKLIVFGDIKTDKKIEVDPRIKSICRDADMVFANLEGPYVEKSEPRKDKKGRPLSSNKNIRKLINDLNISLLSFGNNHILDFGLEGLRESIDLAADLDIGWLGANDDKHENKYIYTDEKNKIVILSFSHREGPVAEVGVDGIGPYALPEFSIIENHILDFNQKGYSVIISYHGGEEFFNIPWPRRYAWSEELIKVGALLVIGHHSHSVQPVLQFENGYLALGLGNTYFHTVYQEKYIGTNEGIFLEIDTEKRNVKYHCLKSNWEDCSLSISSHKELYPESLDKSTIVDYWCREVRQKVYFNRLNVKKSENSKLKYLLSLGIGFLRLIKSSFYSVRDRDILLASIPFFGKYIIYKHIGKNPKKFKY